MPEILKLEEIVMAGAGLSGGAKEVEGLEKTSEAELATFSTQSFCHGGTEGTEGTEEDLSTGRFGLLKFPLPREMARVREVSRSKAAATGVASLHTPATFCGWA